MSTFEHFLERFNELLKEKKPKGLTLETVAKLAWQHGYKSGKGEIEKGGVKEDA